MSNRKTIKEISEEEKASKISLFSALLKSYEISEKTIEEWGADSQFAKATEECAEFIDRKSTRLNSSHEWYTLSLHDALPILSLQCFA